MSEDEIFIIGFIVFILFAGGFFCFSVYGGIKGWNQNYNPHARNKKKALEYRQKVSIVLKELQDALPELRQNYTGDVHLIDKWADKVWEMVLEFTKKMNDDATEAREELEFTQDAIQCGIDRIKSNQPPFDNGFFFESDTVFEGEEEIIPWWFKVLNIFFPVVACLFFYVAFFVVEMSTTVLTFVLAVSLFPGCVPCKDQKVDLKQLFYFILVMIAGWSLNRYIITQPKQVQIIYAIVLPIIYGLIGWVVYHHKKVKEL